MKKTLPKIIPGIKKLPVYLGCITLLFIYSFSNAGTVKSNPPNNTLAMLKEAKLNALTLKGIVKDRVTGLGLPGVSVKVKGSQIGTNTDTNGNFTLQVPDNSTIVFSYIGYEPMEIPVNGQTYLTVALQPVSGNLNEVVVVGYGTQKRTSVTGALSTIPVAEITQKPVVNLTNALVGRASGLIATQGSGEPGFDGSGLLIRGPATTGRTAPLLVVDGVPRDFSRLDPNSIETFTILKDASAVAPYGVAGANGVILITTKSGKTGKPALSFNTYYGIQNPTHVPKFVNSFEYATLRNEAAVNDGVPGSTTTALPYTANDIALFQNHQDPDGHADGHPLDDIIKKNRPISYNNITLSGGTEDIKYFASLGYNRQDGMWDPTYLNKYAGSFSLTAKVTKSTTVDLKVSDAEEDQHFPSIGAGSIIGQAQRQNPTYPVQYSNGLGSGYIGQSLYGEIYLSGYGTNQNTFNYNQLSITQQLPLKGLSIKAVANYDSAPDPFGFSGNSTSIQRNYSLPIPFTNPVSPTGVFGPGITYTYPINIQGSTKPQFTETDGRNLMFTYQGILNYSNSWGKNTVSGTLVAEYRNVKWENFNAKKINYNLSIDELNFGGPLSTDVTAGGSSGGQKSLGYVYRLDYAYANKYFLEVSGRYDGSYIFAPGHRFGFFPAASAGWRISEEKFMKGVTWVDNLKLRGSYGQSGNYPNGGQYQYLNQFGVNSASGIIGNNITQGISENLQGNPNITWEKSTKTNLGLEGTFFRGLLGVEADYFYEKRSNFLVTIGAVLPAEYGVSTGQVNGGILANHGVELTLTSFKNFSNDLRLDVKGTFTFAKNKLLQVFENASTYNNPNRRITGRPLGEQFGLKALGYYTADDFVNPNIQFPVLKPGIPVPNFGQVRPGDLKYADLSGPNNVPDGKVDANDITDIGHPQTPQIIYGLEPRLTYKHFDIDLLFQGSALSSRGLNNYYVYPFLGSGSATELLYQDHWTPATPNALYPRISGTPSSNNTQTSSWFLRNDSYIRLKSAEIGYSFSNKLLGNTIHSLRIYAAGENVFNWLPWAKEQDNDPENSGSGQNYYQQRVVSIGLNATF
jgi:TonB-linked SusC/RagA family outer membrane protein